MTRKSNMSQEAWYITSKTLQICIQKLNSKGSDEEFMTKKWRTWNKFIKTFWTKIRRPWHYVQLTGKHKGKCGRWWSNFFGHPEAESTIRDDSESETRLERNFESTH